MSVESTLNEQREYIKEQEEKSIRANEQYCLVSCQWFTKWKQYVNYEGSSMASGTASYPGPINNEELYIKSSIEGAADVLELRPSMVADFDYVSLPLEAFDRLVEWYGITGPEHKTICKGIDVGSSYTNDFRVEVYQPQLTITHLNAELVKIIVESKNLGK